MSHFLNSSLGGQLSPITERLARQSQLRNRTIFTSTTTSTTTSSTTASIPLLVLEERETYWGVADRDVPILIGAAAGAVGLVFLILGAVVIWYCCQFAFKREKSLYSLENESERGSVSSEGSMQPFSDAVVYMGVKGSGHSRASESNNNAGSSVMKRSMSAPLNAVARGGVAKRGGGFGARGRPRPAFPNKLYQYVQATHAEVMDVTSCSIVSNSIAMNGELDEAPPNASRSYMYEANLLAETNGSNYDDCNSGSEKLSCSETSSGSGTTGEMALSMKSRSLPWKRNATLDDIDSNDEEEEDSLSGDVSHKVNFSKNRKNRMRNDSAAAIALNKSGLQVVTMSAPRAPGAPKMDSTHKDTDSLVDNEAVVVYDERTAL